MRLSRSLIGLGGEHPIKPDSGLIERFINLDLYHQRATDEETEDYLLPSQHALWLRLRSGEVFDSALNIPVSEATRQALLDLESVEVSFNLHDDKANELETRLNKHGAMLKTREARIEALEASAGLLRSNLETRDERIGALEGWTERLKSSLEERTATLRVRDERVKALEDSGTRLRSKLEVRGEMLKAREERIRALEGSTDRLRSNLEERTATLRVRDERIKSMEASATRLRNNLKDRDKWLKDRDKRLEDRDKRLEDRDKRICITQPVGKSLPHCACYRVASDGC